MASWKRGSDFNANGVDHYDWTIDDTRNPDGSLEHTTEKQAGGSLVRTKSYRYTGQRLDNVKTTLPGVSTPSWEVYAYNEFRSTIGVQTGVSSTTAPTLTAPAAAKSEDCSTSLPTTASDTTLYCHDEFDRLSRQRSPGAAEQQQFEYDGMDRRDNRTDHVGGTVEKSGYKYLGASSSIAGQQVATGATTSSAISYDRDSANAPLAVTLQASGTTTQTTRTYATDANGNPTGVENADGTVPAANRYVYDPYGDLDIDANAAMSGDAATNPLRFNGFDYDSAVKTYDMQARDYRPSVGRFLQSDRYESAQSDLSLVADPLTQNRYDFVGDDPVDSVEFDGHAGQAVDGQPWIPSTNGQTVKSQPKHVQKIRRQPAQQADDNTVPAARQKQYDAEIDRTQAKDAKKSGGNPLTEFLGGVTDNAVGTAEGGVAALKAGGRCVVETLPVCGAKATVSAADAAFHPGRTYDRASDAVDGIAADYSSGSPFRVAGRATFDAVTLLATGGEGAAAKGAALTAREAEVAGARGAARGVADAERQIVPKTRTGPGLAAKPDRDPRRLYSRSEVQQGLQEGGVCAVCQDRSTTCQTHEDITSTGTPMAAVPTRATWLCYVPSVTSISTDREGLECQMTTAAGSSTASAQALLRRAIT